MKIAKEANTAELRKRGILKLRLSLGNGPCGICRITLEKGTQLFAIFDVILGMVIFIASLVILLKGDWKLENNKHYYPTEKLNMPRGLVVILLSVGFYHACCALLLFYTAGTRNMGGCYAWLILQFPFNFVSPLKIYESVVVYRLAMEIMEEDKAQGFYFNQVDSGWNKPKNTIRTKVSQVQIAVARA